jgi:serine/threonine protein kinase
LLTQDAERVHRFQTEAKAASALNHPNIQTIHDVGAAAGKQFIATEYVEGQTLRQLLQRGPVPAAQVIEIALQLADALSAAHNAGIVHRDIKPENVMLPPDGYVKVLDFGLAKLTEMQKSERGTRQKEANSSSEVHRSSFRDHPSTMPGKVMGTISYMSPEQALGQPLDQRTDIFSLGVVQCELLSGVQPFRGDSEAATYHRPARACEPDQRCAGRCHATSLFPGWKTARLSLLTRRRRFVCAGAGQWCGQENQQ